MKDILYYIELYLSITGLILAIAIFFYIIIDYKKRKKVPKNSMHGYVITKKYCKLEEYRDTDISGLLFGMNYVEERRKEDRNLLNEVSVC